MMKEKEKGEEVGRRPDFMSEQHMPSVYRSARLKAYCSVVMIIVWKVES